MNGIASVKWQVFRNETKKSSIATFLYSFIAEIAAYQGIDSLNIIIIFVLTTVFHVGMGWTVSYERLPSISIFS